MIVTEKIILIFNILLISTQEILNFKIHKMNKYQTTCLSVMIALCTSDAMAQQWTLKDCIDYALANNISLKKTKLQEYSAMEDVTTFH